MDARVAGYMDVLVPAPKTVPTASRLPTPPR
jgi:hypothetical protein